MSSIFLNKFNKFFNCFLNQKYYNNGMEMNFKDYLTKYRKKAGINKTKLAKRLNINPSYIMNLEAGRAKPPTFERCQQIAKILEMSKDQSKKLFTAAQAERIPKDLKNFSKQYNIDEEKVFNNLYDILKDSEENAYNGKNKKPIVVVGINGDLSEKVALNDYNEKIKVDLSLKIKTDTYKDLKINKNDIILVQSKKISNEDLVLIKHKNKYIIGKYFLKSGKILIQNKDPQIYDKKDIEIVGRICNIIKSI